MEHRYGRHGPHAWCKQRKHRFEQTSIVPVVHIAVVYVQLPVIYAERVIIVINASDLPDGIESNKKIVPTTPTYMRTFIQEPRQAPDVDPFQDIEKAIRSAARIEAFTRAEADYDKLEEYPTKERLQINVRNFASKKVLNITSTQIGQFTPELFDDDLKKFVDLYVDTYVVSYIKNIEGKGATLPIEDEIQMRKAACTDKRNYGNVLSSHLPYLATVRALEYLKPETQSDIDF